MSLAKTKSSFDSLEDDDSSHTPLMFPAHRNLALRKHRPGAGVDALALVQFPDLDDASTSGLEPEAQFLVQGHRILARLTSSGLTLTPVKNRQCWLRGQPPKHIPYSDILSATLLEKLPLLARMSRWLRRKKGGLALAVHGLKAYGFKRHGKKPAQWHYMRLVLLSEDPAIARGWVAEINSAIRSVSAGRPTRLLALVNPKGGARKAATVWAKKAQPILHLAGVECVTVHTEFAEHAHELVANMSLQDLEGYDGILAVGGDGLFQEVLNGLLALRREGGPRAAVAEGLRLAQIPAGSTDAVACTLNGSRAVEASALHVALGDGGCLDVMRVDSADGRTRHSVCYAAYGYMGDLMRRSERIRWVGPLRYALAGAVTFLRGRSYGVHISYVPASPSAGAAESTGEAECTVGCEVCASGVVIAQSHGAFALPAGHAFKGVAAKELQGEFRSVMAVVTPCRSDLSPVGLSPGSHLADGRIRLILVRQCSQLDYLRFLISIPQTGIKPGRFGFVEVLDVVALKVVPQGPQSSWNVDGELLRNNFMEASIHRGLVHVFSRGVPT